MVTGPVMTSGSSGGARIGSWTMNFDLFARWDGPGASFSRKPFFFTKPHLFHGTPIFFTKVYLFHESLSFSRKPLTPCLWKWHSSRRIKRLEKAPNFKKWMKILNLYRIYGKTQWKRTHLLTLDCINKWVLIWKRTHILIRSFSVSNGCNAETYLFQGKRQIVNFFTLTRKSFWNPLENLEDEEYYIIMYRC